MADYRQDDRDRSNAPRRDSSIFSSSDRTDRWREDYQRWSSGPSGRQEPSPGAGQRPPATMDRGSTPRGDYRSNQGPGSPDDRGFFDRAGDEVRSWFGDEEAERRREADARRYEQEHGTAGGYRGGGHDDQWTGGDTGRGGQYSRSPMSSTQGQPGGYSHDRTQGGYGGAGSTYGGQSAQAYGSGQQGDHRAVGQAGSGMGQSYGQSGSQAGGYGQPSSGQSGFGQSGYGQSSFGQPTPSGQSGHASGQSGQPDRGWGQPGTPHHDENYRRWRDQQIQALDREYDEYCRHRQQQFEQDFSSFRQNRQTGITSGGPTMGQSGAPRGSTEIASTSGAAQGMGATTSGAPGGRTAAATTTGGGTASATNASVGSTGMAAETGQELTGAGAGSGKTGKSRS